MPRYLTLVSIFVLSDLSVQTYRYRLTKPRNRICQIGDLGVCKRREYFRHDAVIAVSRIALVLAQSFREIVLALIGDVRNIFAASQIQTMTTVTAMRRDQGAAGLNARGIPRIRRHRRRRQLGDGTGKAAQVVVGEALGHFVHDFDGVLLFAEQIKLDQQIGRRLAAKRRNFRGFRLARLAVTSEARRRALGHSLGIERTDAGADKRQRSDKWPEQLMGSEDRHDKKCRERRSVPGILRQLVAVRALP